MALKTDYQNYIPSTDLRQYQLIENENGTVSLKDVTVYEQVGDLFSAGDMNATNAAVNAIQEDIPTIQSGANTWIASQVTAVNAEAFQYDLTIANYIPAVGNVIVFQAPLDAGESFLFTINGTGPSGGTWYQVAFADLSVDVTGAWVGTAMLNVTISNVVGETGNTLAFFRSGGGGSKEVVPTYTGSSQIFGDGEKGYIEMYDSGVLTFNIDAMVSMFLVGGGGGGAGTRDSSGAGGGGGGYTKTLQNIQFTKNTPYTVTIGAGGGSQAAGGATSIDEYTVNGGAGGTLRNGGAGGSGGGCGSVRTNLTTRGGKGGSNGSNGETAASSYVSGGAGQGSTTYEFLDSQLRLFSGGGGGGGADAYGSAGAGGTGGDGGGGNGASGSASSSPTAGTTNTGGGGGGAGGDSSKAGASGGSGIAIVRWGDWSAS